MQKPLCGGAQDSNWVGLAAAGVYRSRGGCEESIALDGISGKENESMDGKTEVDGTQLACASSSLFVLARCSEQASEVAPLLGARNEVL